MYKSACIGILASALIAGPGLADDRRDRDLCNDLIEEVSEDIEKFQKRDPSDRAVERFFKRLEDDLDDDERVCKTELNYLLGASYNDSDDKRSDKKRSDKKRSDKNSDSRKRADKREEFCEDVVEDVLEELAEFDEERDSRSHRRAKFVKYLIKDLDRDERKCVKFLVDNDNDVSPHKAKNTFDVRKWSYRKWLS